MKTTIVFTKAESDSLTTVQGGQSGYRVDIAVTDVANISAYIFVMQREVPQTDATAFIDTFFDVASCAQLESLPQAGDNTIGIDHPFYRANSLSLVFRTPAELRYYTDLIIDKIDKLRAANDLLINMQPNEKSATPSNTLARYWGLSVGTTITDQILQAGNIDYVYDEVVSKSIANDGAVRHVYLALRADLPAITDLKVNGVSAAYTTVTRSVANANGYAASYNIFCTNGTFNNPTTITLETESA